MKVYVIGRDPVVKAGETAFKINDPSNVISRTHCRITQIDNQTFFIEDAGSKNGIMVNNAPVNQPLQVGLSDSIQLPNKVTFTINDVISGVDINTPESKQKDVEVKEKVKEPQVQQAEPKPPPRHEPQIKKAQEGFKKPQKQKVPVQNSAPLSTGIGGGGIGILPILATAAIVVLAAVSAYYISNYESAKLSGKPSLTDRISGIFSVSTLNWHVYDNGIVRFKYPDDWQIVWEAPDETVVVGNLTNDVAFSVSWVICEQYSGQDVYNAMSNSFNCSMIDKYINDPKSILVIGLANNMTIVSDMTRLRGKLSWTKISVCGDAIDLHEIMMDDAPSKTTRVFQMTAASLVQSNVLLTAAAGCTENEGDKYSEVFKEILRTIEYR